MAGLTAYTWITVYFLVVAVESAYGKHIVGPHLGFGSMWGPTLYTNTISIPPMVAIGLLSGEQEALLRHADCSNSSPVEDADSNQAVVLLVLISCALGVAVAFLGFEARRLVSATRGLARVESGRAPVAATKSSKRQLVRRGRALMKNGIRGV